MPRYVVERSFPGGFRIPPGDAGMRLRMSVIERNSDEGVTWLHSYVSADERKTYCVYDAPTPEAIRTTASGNDLPVDSITEVRVLDPYLYI